MYEVYCKLRDLRGVKDADVVRATGITKSTFSDWKSGRSEPKKEKLQKIIQKKGEVANKVFLGELNEKEILDGFLIHHNHSGFLWGKLILKETYLNALNHIPPFFCTMCEDFLQYFFIAHEAKKYIGIENVVYDYSITSGISSNQTIYSLDRWMQVCSSASVFTTMLNELLYDNPLEYTTEQKDAVKIENVLVDMTLFLLFS